MKLSKNFSLNEFTTSAGLVITPTPQQIFCLEKLCKNVLQPVREKFGPVKITSGLRNKESYESLIAQGYPASKTSDHFAWSDVNPKGTGAADFYCTSQNTMLCNGASSLGEVFHWIIRNLYDKCRQIIYYPDMNVIHVSNNFNSIFMMEDNISSDRRVMTHTKSDGFVPYSI